MKYVIDIPDTDDYKIYSPLNGLELGLPWKIMDKTYTLPTRIKLEPYTEPDRKAIEDKVWNFVDFMIYEMDAGEREECFGESTSAICIHELTYQDAKAKYNEWLKQKDDAAKQKVITLADEIGIHNLYSLVKEIRGE